MRYDMLSFPRLLQSERLRAKKAHPALVLLQ
jgi:hypothetical protein